MSQIFLYNAYDISMEPSERLLLTRRYQKRALKCSSRRSIRECGTHRRDLRLLE